MSKPRPPCQYLAPNLNSCADAHQLKSQFAKANEEFKAQSEIESRPFKKPRISEAVSNSTMPMEQNKMLPGSFFKTRLCNNFQMGSCSYGQRCQFAHGISDLRKTLPNSNWEGRETENLLARTWNVGHRISNQVCRYFFEGTKCIYGEKCRFLHEKSGNSRDKSVISISTAGAKGYHHIRDSAQCQWNRPLDIRKRCGYEAEESGNVQHSKISPSVSTRRMGIGATYYKQVQGMECNVNWHGFEKISRIYADWIEDIPLLHGSSIKVEP